MFHTLFLWSFLVLLGTLNSISRALSKSSKPLISNCHVTKFKTLRPSLLINSKSRGNFTEIPTELSLTPQYSSYVPKQKFKRNFDEIYNEFPIFIVNKNFTTHNNSCILSFMSNSNPLPMNLDNPKKKLKNIAGQSAPVLLPMNSDDPMDSETVSVELNTEIDDGEIINLNMESTTLLLSDIPNNFCNIGILSRSVLPWFAKFGDIVSQDTILIDNSAIIVYEQPVNIQQIITKYNQELKNKFGILSPFDSQKQQKTTNIKFNISQYSLVIFMFDKEFLQEYLDAINYELYDDESLRYSVGTKNESHYLFINTDNRDTFLQIKNLEFVKVQGIRSEINIHYLCSYIRQKLVLVKLPYNPKALGVKTLLKKAGKVFVYCKFICKALNLILYLSLRIKLLVKTCQLHLYSLITKRLLRKPCSPVSLLKLGTLEKTIQFILNFPDRKNNDLIQHILLINLFPDRLSVLNSSPFSDSYPP